jgi:hypothetical protein
MHAGNKKTGDDRPPHDFMGLIGPVNFLTGPPS